MRLPLLKHMLLMSPSSDVAYRVMITSCVLFPLLDAVAAQVNHPAPATTQQMRIPNDVSR